MKERFAGNHSQKTEKPCRPDAKVRIMILECVYRGRVCGGREKKGGAGNRGKGGRESGSRNDRGRRFWDKGEQRAFGKQDYQLY